MTDINLSEHLKETEEYGEILFPKRVKEFIRLLKEEMTKMGGIGHEMIIDKLAGDELI